MKPTPFQITTVFAAKSILNAMAKFATAMFFFVCLATTGLADEKQSEGSATHAPPGAVQPEHGPTTPHSHGATNPDAVITNRRMAAWHYNQGNLAMKKKDWKTAVTNYRMALEMDQEVLVAYVNLSTAYIRDGKLEDAFAVLKSLQAKNPKMPQLHYNLACYHSLKNSIADGMAALKQAVALGFKNFKELESDPDMENLRKSDAYRDWIKTQKTAAQP
jgi:tetratricopeptide (TPR) repeat protein